MHTTKRRLIAFVLAIWGTIAVSCQKEKEMALSAPQSVVSKQNADAELAEAMSADQLVKNYIFADIDFAKEYIMWYKALSTDEQNARNSEVNQAIAEGRDASDPSHTSQEIDLYHANQDAKAQQIREKYPQLASLDDDEYGVLQARVYTTVTQNY